MLYFLTILCIVAADQASKTLVMRSFSLYESRPIIDGLFNLVYVTNTGAAFSFLSDAGTWGHWFFVGVALLAVVGFTWGWWVWARTNRLLTVAMALIVGGAIGNLIDRLRFGAVVDFLDVLLGSYHWPAFNVADSCICVGAGLYIVAAMLVDRQEKNEGGKA
ncbi:MAG: signal peptidase II [Desulfobulbaceae bacterium]|jgi:signal peptidase II|nr:signal peptidase II [Desulfobulbaceae bacterium]